MIGTPILMVRIAIPTYMAASLGKSLRIFLDVMWVSLVAEISSWVIASNRLKILEL